MFLGGQIENKIFAHLAIASLQHEWSVTLVLV